MDPFCKGEKRMTSNQQVLFVLLSCQVIVRQSGLGGRRSARIMFCNLAGIVCYCGVFARARHHRNRKQLQAFAPASTGMMAPVM
jgi:hypothetical protein